MLHSNQSGVGGLPQFMNGPRSSALSAFECNMELEIL